MAETIDRAYNDAVASGLLPGVSAIAGDRNGNIIYSRSLGRASLKEGRDDPFTDSSICGVASLTKLATSVAVLKCVEEGKIDLDQNLRPLLPEMGQYGVITGFDEQKNEAILRADSTPISLRLLLSHTSGQEYDWFNALLGKWRASRNEEINSGDTVATRAALPLIFTPGTGFAYGHGHDWAGKAIEKVTGMSLDEYMHHHLWAPLGIEEDLSFFPEKIPVMEKRIATVSTLNGDGNPPATDAPFFDVRDGAIECLGGAGLFASARGYYTFLSALFQRDSRILKPESYDELFRPQLDEKQEQAFNDYLVLTPSHTGFLRLQTPVNTRMTWSFAGMVAKEGVEGRFKKGTTFWSGATNTLWFMDHEAGVFGTTMIQMVPPAHPPIVSLHVKFQEGLNAIATSNLPDSS